MRYLLCRGGSGISVCQNYLIASVLLALAHPELLLVRSSRIYEAPVKVAYHAREYCNSYLIQVKKFTALLC